MREKYLIFGAPYIGEEEIAEVEATLRSGWIGTGPRTARFEEAFAAYVGTPHAVAVASCTAALHLSILALDLEPGDEVITTPLTFCATANAILHSGAKPIFAEVDPVTLNLDPGAVAAVITERTRAILPVHLYGRSCDMKGLLDLAQCHGLKLIGDCAHAIETEWQGRRVGALGDMACFSFYPTKNLVTIEGGMVTTHDEDWAAKIKRLALHGMSKDAWKRFSDTGYRHYQVVNPGYKYNMTDVQAAMGLPQLARLETMWLRRQEIWNRYQAAFSALPVQRPAPVAEGTRHAYHLYTLNPIPGEAPLNRDALLQALHERNIGCGVHYIAVHLQPYYRETYGTDRGDFPIAEAASDTTLSLPLGGILSDDDVSDVIEAVTGLLG